MPGPCSAFQSVNNFGNRFYPKEKSTAWPLLFSIPKFLTVEMHYTDQALGCPFDVSVLDWDYSSGALKSPNSNIFTSNSLSKLRLLNLFLLACVT